MPVKIPSDFMSTWNELYAAGNVDGILDLYDDSIVLVGQPGTRVSGKEQVRAVIDGFLAMSQDGLDLKPGTSVDGPNHSVTYGDWVFDGVGPDGPVHIEARATAVLIQKEDGWYAVLDDFFSQA